MDYFSYSNYVLNYMVCMLPYFDNVHQWGYGDRPPKRHPCISIAIVTRKQGKEVRMKGLLQVVSPCKQMVERLNHVPFRPSSDFSAIADAGKFPLMTLPSSFQLQLL